MEKIEVSKEKMSYILDSLKLLNECEKAFIILDLIDNLESNLYVALKKDDVFYELVNKIKLKKL